MTQRRTITESARDNPELARRAVLAVQFHPYSSEDWNRVKAAHEVNRDTTWDDVFAWAAAGDVSALRSIGDTLGGRVHAEGG